MTCSTPVTATSLLSSATSGHLHSHNPNTLTNSRQICHSLWTAVWLSADVSLEFSSDAAKNVAAGFNEAQIFTKPPSRVLQLHTDIHSGPYSSFSVLIFTQKGGNLITLLRRRTAILFKSGWFRGWHALTWESLTARVGVEVCQLLFSVVPVCPGVW